MCLSLTHKFDVHEIGYEHHTNSPPHLIHTANSIDMAAVQIPQ